MTGGDVEFAHFSLSGPRFDAPGMPAESASEISAYRELIYSVARHLWVDAHPGRQRVPTGFKEAFDLRLTEVKPGSARPQLILHRPNSVTDADFDEWTSIYFRARDYATEAVRTIGSEGVLPRKFPRNSVVRLRALGRTLVANEQITVGPPKFEGPKASLDENFRRIIRTIDEQLEPSLEEVVIEGGIYEYDSSNRSFRLQSLDGDWITCHFDITVAYLARAVRDNLSVDGLNAPDVRVTGEAVLDEEGLFEVVSGVRSVDHVRSITEKAAVSKLRELANLGEGWSGPGSLAPSHEALSAATDLVKLLREVDVEVAFGPTSDGSVVLEWSRGEVEYTAEISATGDRMFLCADNTRTDELEELSDVFNRVRLERFLTTGNLGE